VAVLFVLGVTTVGDSGSFARPQVPRWLAGALVLLCIGILGWQLQSNLDFSPAGNSQQVGFARRLGAGDPRPGRPGHALRRA